MGVSPWEQYWTFEVIPIRKKSEYGKCKDFRQKIFNIVFSK